MLSMQSVVINQSKNQRKGYTDVMKTYSIFARGLLLFTVMMAAVLLSINVMATTLPVNIPFCSVDQFDNNFKQNNNTPAANGLHWQPDPSGVGGVLLVQDGETGQAVFDTTSNTGVIGWGGTNGSNANNDLQDFVASIDWKTSSTNLYVTTSAASVGILFRLNNSNAGGYQIIADFQPTGMRYRFFTNSTWTAAGTVQTGTVAGLTVINPNQYYTFQVSCTGQVITASTMDMSGNVISSWTVPITNTLANTGPGQIGIRVLSGASASQISTTNMVKNFSIGQRIVQTCTNNTTPVALSLPTLPFCTLSSFQNNFVAGPTNSAFSNVGWTNNPTYGGPVIQVLDVNGTPPGQFAGHFAYDTSAFGGGASGLAGTNGLSANNNLQDFTMSMDFLANPDASGTLQIGALFRMDSNYSNGYCLLTDIVNGGMRWRLFTGSGISNLTTTIQTAATQLPVVPGNIWLTYTLQVTGAVFQANILNGTNIISGYTFVDYTYPEVAGKGNVGWRLVNFGPGEDTVANNFGITNFVNPLGIVSRVTSQCPPSNFEITSITNQPGVGIIITWNSITNQVYVVQSTDNSMTNSFTDRPDGVVTASDVTASYTNTVAVPARFYRVRFAQ
jgi:hypothetical protein